MASGGNRNFVGYYLGTGAAQTLSVCGFDPRHVKITRMSDGVETVYFRGETVPTAVAGGFTRSAVGAVTALTAAQGVSQVDDVQGFQVGTDDVVSQAGTLFAYVAQD